MDDLIFVADKGGNDALTVGIIFIIVLAAFAYYLFSENK